MLLRSELKLPSPEVVAADPAVYVPWFHKSNYNTTGGADRSSNGGRTTLTLTLTLTRTLTLTLTQTLTLTLTLTLILTLTLTLARRPPRHRHSHARARRPHARLRALPELRPVRADLDAVLAARDRRPN